MNFNCMCHFTLVVCIVLCNVGGVKHQLLDCPQNRKSRVVFYATFIYIPRVARKAYVDDVKNKGKRQK